MSKVMKKYCSMTVIKQIRTSPCHPQTDVTVERFNATLNRLLRILTQTLRLNGTYACFMYCGCWGQNEISMGYASTRALVLTKVPNIP